MVTLGLRDDQQVEGLAEMYRGMAEACRSHGGWIAGGDVVRSPVFFVNVAMVGRAGVTGPDGRGTVLMREAADLGDVIAVTGTLGDSASGLHTGAGRERNSTTRPRGCAWLTSVRSRDSRQDRLSRRPEFATAMDISDGLVGDLTKLCDASGVGRQ